MSAAASADPNSSLYFIAFLITFIQNVITPGSQCFLPLDYIKMYLAKKVFIRFITEIRCEIRRRRLKLPRVNILKEIYQDISSFRKQEKKLTYSYTCLRLKKRKFKILSRW